MRDYRSTWFTGVATCCAVGSTVSAVAFPLVVWFAFAGFAVCAACLVAIYAVPLENASTGLVLRLSGLFTAVLAGVFGLVSLLGATGWGVLVVAVLTGVPLVRDRRYHRTGHDRTTKPAARRSTAEPTDDRGADELTTPALCWAWRRSYLALANADDADVADRLRIVAQRQRFLDELCTREPAGFHNWLAAGARAAGDPSRYVCASRSR